MIEPLTDNLPPSESPLEAPIELGEPTRTREEEPRFELPAFLRRRVITPESEEVAQPVSMSVVEGPEQTEPTMVTDVPPHSEVIVREGEITEEAAPDKPERVQEESRDYFAVLARETEERTAVLHEEDQEEIARQMASLQGTNEESLLRLRQHSHAGHLLLFINLR